MVVRVLLALLGVVLLSAAGNSQAPASSEPPSHVIASGTLTSAEPIEGTYYEVNQLVLMVHPQGVPRQILRDYLGQSVEVVIRVVPPRETPKRLQR